MVLTNAIPRFQAPKQANPAITDLESIFGNPNPPPAKAPARTATPKAAAPEHVNSCSMSARLFSVDDSRTLWIGKVTVNMVGATAQDYSDAIKAAADAIAQAIPARAEQKK